MNAQNRDRIRDWALARSRAARRAALALAARWQDDRRGAALVQFVVVLPVFVLVAWGMYGLFTVMASRDTLCESAWEAARYLQVEAPHFPTDDLSYDYPEGWKRVAVEIMNEELLSRTHTNLYPIDPVDVDIQPPWKPRSPEDTMQVSRDEVINNRFEIKVSKTITNPLGTMLGVDPGLSKINLTCRSSGFFEGPPLEPTNSQRNQGKNRCEEPRDRCGPCPGCTPTVVGENTPTVCPTCRP